MTSNLVTGADGFVGQHLVDQLLEAGEEVLGAVRRLPPKLTTLSPENAQRVKWLSFELSDRNSVREALRGSYVDRIFHLAGLSSPAKSRQDPVSTFEINAVGTLFLLEELAQIRSESGFDPKIIISGSAQVYGSAAARHRPLIEASPLEPINPYGASKLAQEMLALQYHRVRALSVVVTRGFNHTGPGQRTDFVAPQLAARIKRVMRQGGSGIVEVANAAFRRDFTDVRDVARAYRLLAQRGEVGGVYNVCSGRAYAIRELLAMLAEIAGVDVEVVEVDGDPAPGGDILEVVGSCRRLAEATGWTAEIDLRQSLRDLLAGLEPA